MVNYNLTVNSNLEGVPFSIKAGALAEWNKTSKTYSLPENTEVAIRVNPNYYDGSKTYKFKVWEDGSTSPFRTFTLTEDMEVTATYEEIPYVTVKPYTIRKARFEAKVDPDIYETRTDALSSLMKEQYRALSTLQVDLEQKVGDYLNSLGLTGITLHHYRNFSQELFSLSRRFKDQTLNVQATIMAQKWVSRGLNPDILKHIAQILGITLNIT